MSSISLNEVWGRKVLIMGDVGTGKTALTRRILEEVVEKGYDYNVTVLDMAPQKTTVNGLPVGGRLTEKNCGKVRMLEAKDVKTPRLSAGNSEELMDLAEYNRKAIESLIDDFSSRPTSILFVNDVSMYLQLGDLEHLWRSISKANTVVANGYWGTKLKDDFGTGVSYRERRLMEELAARMDVVVRT